MSNALDIYILGSDGEPLAEPRAEMVESFMLPVGAPIMMPDEREFPILWTAWGYVVTEISPERVPQLRAELEKLKVRMVAYKPQAAKEFADAISLCRLAEERSVGIHIVGP